MADYIRAWATKHRHNIVDTGDSGNVIVRVAASKDRENEPVLILQGHMDMVCLPQETTPAGNNPRLGKIAVVRDGDWIRAADTTLGADNGVGVAMMLAIVQDTTLTHGPLELLFTVEEEDGLKGAAKVLPAQLFGRTLLNLDSETVNEITIGSAGGRDIVITLEQESFAAKSEAAWKVALTGLRGGHSGVEINAGRLNAIHGLARTLRGMGSLRLCDFTATGRRNAIAAAASAVILSTASQAMLQAAVDAAAAALRTLFPGEASFDLKLTSAAVAPGWSAGDSARAVALLHALPAGVISMSQDPKLTGIVETSSNIGVISTAAAAKTRLTIECSSRSMVRSGLDDVTGTVAALAELAGGTVAMSEPYPGWKPNSNSKVLERLVASYERVNGGVRVKVQAVHAGLECGVLVDRLPGLDAVSFGPTVESPHSISERIDIKSVGVAYNALRDLLATPVRD